MPSHCSLFNLFGKSVSSIVYVHVKTFIRLVHVFFNAIFFNLCNVFNAISQNAHKNRWIATDRLYVRYESGRGCLDKLVIFWVNMNEIRSSSASYEHIVPGLKHGFIKIDVRYCILQQNPNVISMDCAKYI